MNSRPGRNRFRRSFATARFERQRVFPEELDQLRQQGAVGDVCLRFFDVNGNPIENALDNRVIGMQLEQLGKVERSVGIAGGKRKFEAIRGALRGKLINVLITDRRTAERLVDGVQ